MTPPRRRKSDRGWRWLVRQTYREAWLIVITLVVFLALTQNAQQNDDIVNGARRACERHNILRDNQVFGLRAQIVQSERSLKRDLGPALEPFREQIKDQLETRKESLHKLLVDARDAPDPDNPYLVDCKKAHPYG